MIRRAPQRPYPNHFHDFAELVIVYRGIGTHFTEDETYTVQQGDVFVIQGDRRHGYRNLDNLYLINILFRWPLLDLPAADLAELPGYRALFTWEPRLRRQHGFSSRLSLKTHELNRLMAMVEELETELSERREGYRCMARAAFMRICGYLSRTYARGSRRGARELTRIGDLLEYLEKNVRRSVTIPELTQRSGVSESTLLRLFKRNTGQSPLEYHHRLRINTACDLLRSTDWTVTEIAFELGYRDSNYLSRQFHRRKGMSPKQYRAAESSTVQ